MFKAILAVSLMLMAAAVCSAQITFSESSVSNPPNSMVLGPDGNGWFTEFDGNKIGKITPDGVVTEYSAGLTAGGGPYGIVRGSDDNLWFTEYYANKIGKITTDGVITEYSIPTGASGAVWITAGPDGNLWFVEQLANQIGRITTAGDITEFSGLTSGSYPAYIIAGPDGNLWFTEVYPGRVGKITTAGVITEFPPLPGSSRIEGIALGPDGNFWMADNFANEIIRMTPAGAIQSFPIPTSNSGAVGIISGPDGDLWFAENRANNIARITLDGVITEFSTPSANPERLAIGSDGHLWFTEGTANKIGKVVLPATSLLYRVYPAAGPIGIVAGPDGNLWYSEGFVSGDHIGRMTPYGATTLYPVPSGNAEGVIVKGSDDNLWFTEYRTNRVGRITAGGTTDEFVIPTGGSFPYGMTAGPDSNVWFAVGYGPANVGKINLTTGDITEYPVPSGNAQMITTGPDGNLWFTENVAGKIGRMTPTGDVTEFSIPSANSIPGGIVAAPDGYLWFAEQGANKIGRISIYGVVTEYPLPPGTGPAYVAVGPDGNVWFTENTERIGKITSTGVITEFSVPPSLVIAGLINLGPDSNLWFTDYYGNKIVKVIKQPFDSQPPTVTFTGAPASAAYQSQFTVSATTNSSVTPVLTATGPCTISGDVVTMSGGAGTCTIAADWAADNIYAATFAEQSTSATKLTPTVDWSTPAPLSFGTALSSLQLNATASVPGTIVYTPPAGTYLNPGNQQILSLAFTPTEAENYATVTATVMIDVVLPTQITLTEYPLPSVGSGAEHITPGPNGSVWFGENNNPNNGGNRGDRVGRIDTATGLITEYTVLQSPLALFQDPAGNIWVSEYFSQNIARITPEGIVTQFPIGGYPAGMTAGSDGNMWFTERYGNNIGRINPITEEIAEFPIPTGGSETMEIASDIYGTYLWFTESAANQIGRINPITFQIDEFPLPTAGSNPGIITAGPDGNMWFVESLGNRVGKITPDGVITEFQIPTEGDCGTPSPSTCPNGITLGPDGNIWFTERYGNKIAKIDPNTGAITEYPLPEGHTEIMGITTGPDGNLWFTEAGTSNRIVKVVLNNVPPSGIAVTFNPASVVGSKSATGRVTLSSPAPVGGLLVTLSSSNPGVASVPATVLVNAGSKTTTFSISTSPVQADSTVSISAVAVPNVGGSGNLVVKRPILMALKVAPASVVGSVTAASSTVTLMGVAPAGGTTVQLTSSNPAATVPASVVVPEGQTVSPTFAITTSVVAVPTVVTVTATYNGVSKTDTLTVNPLGVSTLTISPATVAGGTSTNGNHVKLSAPALAGGSIVTLVSDNPSVASMPATITVPEGATTSPNFTVTTSTVTAPTAVTFTATYNGVSKTDTLTVNPPSLSMMKVALASVVGSVSVVGNTVTLGSVAPVGGITVQLTSSDPAATVPATVMVPEGQTASPAFTIPTTVVAAPTIVTITATFNGVNKTDTLTVNPIGVSTLTISPASVAGGVSTNGNRVKLNAPALAGGTVVTMVSNTPGVASLPASVTVAEGATTSPNFTITTSAVTAPTIVTFTATYNGVSKTDTLTVNPPSLSMMKVASASVVGSVTVAGNTVTLGSVAPVGGVVVQLSSSDPSATVPSSVVVPEGQTVSPAFAIPTTVVATQTTVTITATYNGVNKTDTLVVKPIGVNTLTLSPANVAGGVATNNNRVTLNAPALAGGSVVTLVSDNPTIAAVPASITVAGGATISPNFTITTSTVTSTITVNVTATYNGVSKTSVLTVHP